jgi:ATP-dependent 26S proteasome regulatory subunit
MDIESPVRHNTFDEESMSDENLYLKMKEVEAEIEFLKLQEDFIREEQKNLKKELIRAKEEIKRIQAVPLVIGQFIEMVDLEHGKGVLIIQDSSAQPQDRLTMLESSVFWIEKS